MLVEQPFHVGAMVDDFLLKRLVVVEHVLRPLFRRDFFPLSDRAATFGASHPQAVDERRHVWREDELCDLRVQTATCGVVQPVVAAFTSTGTAEGTTVTLKVTGCVVACVPVTCVVLNRVVLVMVLGCVVVVDWAMRSM